MMEHTSLEFIDCPFCSRSEFVPWSVELGFSVVRCKSCSLIYVNPRPTLDLVNRAVRLGVHGESANGLDVSARRVNAKIRRYKSILGDFFRDIWSRRESISWLDVGAGYGEVMEAVDSLSPPGSRIEGLEPMHVKAEAARRRGLTIIEDYLHRSHDKVQIVSFIDVFSHIPDFRSFLEDVKAVLKPGGEIFMETGNLSDLTDRQEFPDELGVPDHLVFAGEAHLRGFLREAGFEVVRLERRRIDGPIHTAKGVVKRILGRPGPLRLPYTSKYRQLLVRARLREPAA